MRKKLLLSLLVVCLAGMMYLLFENYHIGIPCPIYEVTHYYCPGCGITRALVALVHGNFLQAFRYNMLVIILLPFALPLLGNSYCCWLRGNQNLWAKRIPNVIWYGVIVLALLFGILRNLEPFSFLAPTIL